MTEDDRVALTVREVQQKLSVGRTTASAIAKEIGFRAGRQRLLVTFEELVSYIARRVEPQLLGGIAAVELLLAGGRPMPRAWPARSRMSRAPSASWPG